eukprot:4880408-Lingulodinium_polyedra.AAC.1
MPGNDFVEWAKGRYQQCGCLLHGKLNVQEGFIDWELTVGEFRFVVPEGAKDDTVLDEIYSASTGQRKQLPEDM